jgi:hypothetical protein
MRSRRWRLALRRWRRLVLWRWLPLLLLLLLSLPLLLGRQRRLRQPELRLSAGEPDCNGRKERRHDRAGEQKLADFAHDLSPNPTDRY